MKETELTGKKPEIHPALHLQVGDFGMGMPVIPTWQAMGKLKPGEIVQLSSSHP